MKTAKTIVSLILLAATLSAANVQNHLDISAGILENLIKQTDPGQRCASATVKGIYLEGFGIIYTNRETSISGAIRKIIDLDFPQIPKIPTLAPLPPLPPFPSVTEILSGDTIKVIRDGEVIILDSRSIAENDSLKELYKKLQRKLKDIDKDEARWQADRQRYEKAIEKYKQEEEKIQERIVRFEARQDSIRQANEALLEKLETIAFDFFENYAPVFPSLKSNEKIIIHLNSHCDAIFGESESIQAEIGYKALRQYQLGKSSAAKLKKDILIHKQNSAAANLDELNNLINQCLQQLVDSEKTVPDLKLDNSIVIENFGPVFYIGADPFASTIIKATQGIKEITLFLKEEKSGRVIKHAEDEFHFDQDAVTEMLLSQLGSYGKMISSKKNCDKLVFVFDLSHLPETRHLILTVNSKDLLDFFQEKTDMKNLKRKMTINITH
jgi:predicted Holliday junction resolvase-like endonuclease